MTPPRLRIPQRLAALPRCFEWLLSQKLAQQSPGFHQALRLARPGPADSILKILRTLTAYRLSGSLKLSLVSIEGSITCAAESSHFRSAEGSLTRWTEGSLIVLRKTLYLCR